MSARRSFLARCLLLLAMLGAASQAGAAAPLSVQQMRDDFQLARRAIEEAHAGIYRYTPKNELDRVFETAAAQLDHPMDAMAFQRILSPAVAAVRCGHTAVQLWGETKAQTDQALLLPLDVKVIGGRIFILRDFDAEGKLAGREITAVNGVPARRLVETMMTASQGDGFVPTGRAARVNRIFKEGLLRYFGMSGSFKVKLANSWREVHLRGQLLANLQELSRKRYPPDQHNPHFMELSFLDEGRIARMTIFNFLDDEEDDDGSTLLRKAFEKIAATGSQTLILDLRNNGGGQDALGKKVYSYLVDKPFPYYQSLIVNRPGLSFASNVVEGGAGVPAGALEARADGLYDYRSHPNLGIQQPREPTFSGKVIALINGGSFSTTSELLTQLHDKKRAVFVGEESAGAYHGNSSGNDALLELPNSGLRVFIPLITYTLAVDSDHPIGRGVMPDHVIEPTIEDYLNGRDPQLEQALKLARSVPAQ
jgi:hypothetical protein